MDRNPVSANEECLDQEGEGDEFNEENDDPDETIDEEPRHPASHAIKKVRGKRGRRGRGGTQHDQFMRKVLSKVRPGCCALCNTDTDDELLCGKLYQYTEEGGAVYLRAHFFCLLLSSGLSQNGKEADGIFGFLRHDIDRELKRGSKLSCKVCKQSGATIGCAEPSCKFTFHLPCGKQQNTFHYFYDQFKSYCVDHAPSQAPASRRPRPFPHLCFSGTGRDTCPVCQDRIPTRTSREIVRTDCCKPFWYHHACLQNMALNFGKYFLKCPNCRDNAKFHQRLLECGIYIPERDASWEQGEAAFTELNREIKCFAETCLAENVYPDGRLHYVEDCEWAIGYCDICGAEKSGVHPQCLGLQTFGEFHVCDDCKEADLQYGLTAAMRSQAEQEDALTKENAALVCSNQIKGATPTSSIVTFQGTPRSRGRALNANHETVDIGLLKRSTYRSQPDSNDFCHTINLSSVNSGKTKAVLGTPPVSRKGICDPGINTLSTRSSPMNSTSRRGNRYSNRSKSLKPGNIPPHSGCASVLIESRKDLEDMATPTTGVTASTSHFSPSPRRDDSRRNAQFIPRLQSVDDALVASVTLRPSSAFRRNCSFEQTSPISPRISQNSPVKSMNEKAVFQDFDVLNMDLSPVASPTQTSQSSQNGARRRNEAVKRFLAAERSQSDEEMKIDNNASNNLIAKTKSQLSKANEMTLGGIEPILLDKNDCDRHKLNSSFDGASSILPVRRKRVRKHTEAKLSPALLSTMENPDVSGNLIVDDDYSISKRMRFANSLDDFSSFPPTIANAAPIVDNSDMPKLDRITDSPRDLDLDDRISKSDSDMPILADQAWSVKFKSCWEKNVSSVLNGPSSHSSSPPGLSPTTDEKCSPIERKASSQMVSMPSRSPKKRFSSSDDDVPLSITKFFNITSPKSVKISNLNGVSKTAITDLPNGIHKEAEGMVVKHSPHRIKLSTKHSKPSSPVMSSKPVQKSKTKLAGKESNPTPSGKSLFSYFNTSPTLKQNFTTVMGIPPGQSNIPSVLVSTDADKKSVIVKNSPPFLNGYHERKNLSKFSKLLSDDSSQDEKDEDDESFSKRVQDSCKKPSGPKLDRLKEALRRQSVQLGGNDRKCSGKERELFQKSAKQFPTSLISTNEIKSNRSFDSLNGGIRCAEVGSGSFREEKQQDKVQVEAGVSKMNNSDPHLHSKIISPPNFQDDQRFPSAGSSDESDSNILRRIKPGPKSVKMRILSTQFKGALIVE